MRERNTILPYIGANVIPFPVLSNRHTRQRMSRKASRHKTGAPKHEIPGNQHLVSIIIVLTAILLILTTYTFIYNRQPNSQGTASTSSTSNASSVKDVKPDTPTGLKTFAGTIQAVRGSEITVRTSVVKDGKQNDRNVSVTYDTNTKIVKPSAIPVGVPDANVQTMTADEHVTRANLKVGTQVRVSSGTVVDDLSSVIAERIEIL